jgi:hypothetical protein
MNTKKTDKMNKLDLFILILQQIEHFETKKTDFIVAYCDFYSAEIAQKKIDDLNNILKTEYLPIFN